MTPKEGKNWREGCARILLSARGGVSVQNFGRAEPGDSGQPCEQKGRLRTVTETARSEVVTASSIVTLNESEREKEHQ